jgi:hypothetical protein
VRKFRQKKRWIQPIVQIWRLQSIFPLNVAKVGHFAPKKKAFVLVARSFFCSPSEEISAKKTLDTTYCPNMATSKYFSS